MLRNELYYDLDPAIVQEDLQKLNTDQRRATARILRAVEANRNKFSEPEERHKLFFLNGPGGTGKTFV